LVISMGYGGGGAPSWVYEQRKAISDMSHDSYEHQLQDRIRELEKENSELKRRIAELEQQLKKS
jgi:cell division septum initiation protein DivIVA